MTTSDATPDTPDPRETPRPELDHVYEFLYDQELIVEGVTGVAYQPTMTTAIRIANALSDAGLLVLPDEGSLRSQASGTPTAWEVAEAMHATDTPKPLADAHPAVQTALVRRAQAAIDHITGATS